MGIRQATPHKRDVMKHLIIVASGGMGRTVYSLAKECIGYGSDFDIKGFIDDNLKALDGFSNYPALLGTIKDYRPQPDDVFVSSIGNTRINRLVCDSLKKRGAKFIPLIHQRAVVRSNAVIGDGSIICEFATIGADAKVGCNCLVQAYACVAHDCVVGDYVRIDTHCTCVGGVEIKDGAMIHTSAVLSHNVVVEENAVVGACSFVIRRVKAGTTVTGNPARRLNK